MLLFLFCAKLNGAWL